MKTKVCTKCKKEKDIKEFLIDKRHIDGFRGHCRECRNEYSREWVKNNLERRRKNQREWDRNNVVKRWCFSTLNNHKRSGYKVLFTWKELLPLAKKIKFCPICNTNLDWKYGTGRNYNSPSLDRKDNENTLTLDNTWIICNKCNGTKRNRTVKEFIEYCEMVTNKFKKGK